MRHESLSDYQLVALFAGGDRLAFEVLYERYWKALYRVAYRILDDAEASKDVVQEVFISFFEHARTRQIDNLKAYLFQCAKYQCFMQLRAGRISEKHLRRMNTMMFSNCTEEEQSAAELEQILRTGMQSLPEKCREVFYLSRMEYLPNKQIAEQLKISPKTVENQITKALKVLRMTVDKLGLIFLAVTGGL